MKRLCLHLLFAAVALQVHAFEWTGGTMNIPYVFRGEETFAGWVPSSPWGSTVFIQDPAVELRDAASQLIAVYPATGGTMDWYDGATRSGTATFSMPAGTYSVTTREGRRHIRISGEGWSGFKLVADSITEPVPPNGAPTVAWSIAPGTAGHCQGYTVAAHGHDDDGNLVQVNVWKNGQPFAFGGGGNGFDADSGNATSDSGPQTVTFIAQTVDGTGATSAVISHTVTIDPPPPAVQYSLMTAAGPGGTVSPGGIVSAGDTAVVVATPQATYDFVGWAGDASGTANPLGVLMDRDKWVQATFALKFFTLTTSAMSGGSTTPGGTYPYGTTVTIAAVPDAAHYFTGWTGDAAGAASAIAVLLDRAKFVQALFAPKAAQSISFNSPGDQNVGANFPLTATSTSGLPVSFVVLSGPATFSGGTLSVTGPGAVTIQAVQPGDTYTLAAAPVTGTFNAAAPAVLKYQAAARTLLQTGRTAEATNYVLGNP
jgi:hypothetical protein